MDFSGKELKVSLLVFVALSAGFFWFIEADAVKVKIVVDTNNHSAVVVPVSSNEVIGTSISCRLEQWLKQYFGDGKVGYDAGAYNQAVNKSAVCAAGYLEASTILAERGDIETGISEVDRRISSLNNTKKYIADNKFSPHNLNGLKLAAIPIGSIAKKSYETAVNVSAMCVADRVLGTIEPVVPIGEKSSYEGVFFDPLPSISKEKMEEVRANNRLLKSKLDSGDIKTKDSVLMPLNNQRLVARYFIPVTFADLETNYKPFYVSKNYLQSGFQWVLNKKGKKIVDKFTWVTKELLAGWDPALSSVDDATMMNVTVEDIIYEKTLVPEPLTFNALIETIAVHMSLYTKMKTDLEIKKTALDSRLDTLISNNYNCL